MTSGHSRCLQDYDLAYKDAFYLLTNSNLIKALFYLRGLIVNHHFCDMDLLRKKARILSFPRFLINQYFVQPPGLLPSNKSAF
jgi:hypothetical protein